MSNSKRQELDYLYKSKSLEELVICRNFLRSMIKNVVIPNIPSNNNSFNYYHGDDSVMSERIGARCISESLINEKIYLDKLIKKRKDDIDYEKD